MVLPPRHAPRARVVSVGPWAPSQIVPKDHRDMRILQTMVSGIPLVLGLRAGM